MPSAASERQLIAALPHRAARSTDHAQHRKPCRDSWTLAGRSREPMVVRGLRRSRGRHRRDSCRATGVV